MSDIQIIVPSDAPRYKALKRVLGVLKPDLQIECAQDGKPETNASKTIGLIVALSHDEFFTELESLEEVGVQKAIVLRRWSQKTPALAALLPEDRVSFADFCIPATPDLQSILNAISSTLESAEDKVGRECRRQVFAARKCYKERIAGLAHGSSNDVVNCIYAPARMLCLSYKNQRHPDIARSWEEWWAADTTRAAYSKLNDCTINRENSPQSHDALTDSFQDAWNRAKAWIPKNTETSPSIEDAPVAQMERLMSLLTSIRQRAGMPVHPQDSLPAAEQHVLPVEKGCTATEAPSSIWGVEPYRLLVVDDHAASWRPILGLLAKQLAVDEELGRRPVNIEFVTSVSENVLRVISEYDLVLLDIYLPGQRGTAGVHLLKQVRRMMGSLPIVLWTSSMDRDLPAEATLANGFLFKKTATVESIFTSVKAWLSAGRSQRLWSLPNPFFDNAIRDLALREVALDFTKWTLRYMDCFHAIDNFHFRYFNDHGGRHIIGVLSVMEKLLRPFLLGDAGVLSPDSVGRTHDLFCLYVAVLCHEFGMFPIMDTDLHSDAVSASPEQAAQNDREKRRVLEAMRDIHALRGMMMLASNCLLDDVPKTARYEKGVAGIGCRLCALQRTNDDLNWLVIALLIGYHQRLLPLSENSDGSAGFLSMGNAQKKLAEKPRIMEANDVLCCSGVPIAAIEALFAYARQNFSLERQRMLRRQCAILRFADALDVDHTRAPADFLLSERTSRRPMQDVEDCKRLVLAECRIDGGVIKVGFLAPKPSEGYSRQLLHLCRFSVAYHMEHGENRKVKAKAKAVHAWLEEHKDGENPTHYSEIDQMLVNLQKAWDVSEPKKYLEMEWVKQISGFMTHAVAGYFLMCNPKMSGRVIGEQRVDAPTLRKMQPAVASVASLLVLLEVLDEYQAIYDVELADTIRLSPVPLWRVKEAELPFILSTALDSIKAD